MFALLAEPITHTRALTHTHPLYWFDVIVFTQLMQVDTLWWADRPD